MSDWGKPIGSIHTSTPAALAAKCADRIMECREPRAVTLDPDGKVWIESPNDAAECDLVGVWQRDIGLLALTRDIRDNLVDEKDARGLVRRKRALVLSERELERRRVGI